jgi:hypothetical protein
LPGEKNDWHSKRLPKLLPEAGGNVRLLKQTVEDGREIPSLARS